MSRPAVEIVEEEYRQRLAQRRLALAARERSHARYAAVRLLVFFSGVAIVAIGGLGAANWLTVPFAAFVVVAVAHARLLNARDRARSAVSFYERGLARVAHEWIGHGRDGRHLAPAEHPYAEDLDIFGRGSIFELLATTRTHAGEETLARWLLEPAAPEVVTLRQEAVRELAGRLDLREAVAVMGDEVRLGVHAGLLRRWSTSPVALRGAWMRVSVTALVTLTLGVLVFWYQSDRFGAVLLGLAIAQMAVAAYFKPRVVAVIEAVDEPAHDLALLAGLLDVIEREPFSSECLRRLQASIAVSGRRASQEIGRLSSMVAMLSSRNNVIFAVPAAVLMWATQWAFAIEAWRHRAGTHVPKWLDAVGEFEALLALSTFAAEHPAYVFPEYAGGPASLNAEQVAHPAIGDRAVPNSLALGPDAARLFIVSGSNMSGKSTLLRAVGVNAVLAQMGAPVRATSFRLSPLAIGAAIRVQDSLTDGRSRFFAEILRLKLIVDLSASRSGQVLFLLDEILAGTNSHDRRIGSEAVLTGLVDAGAIGLVTTHDLALGEIADRMPDRARNVHFEDRFDDGSLTFDYQLRPGLVRTSNAVALMQSIGLLTQTRAEGGGQRAEESRKEESRKEG